MFSEPIKDLAKPQWLATIETLKTHGGLPVRELAEALGVSYMAAKQYGEDLTELGYLQRIRTPRATVGRPEISYRVTTKSDALFPDIGLRICLELLENSRQLFGENAPEQLIYQHFQALHTRWEKILSAIENPWEKAAKLADLRNAYGVGCIFEIVPGAAARIIDHHHPLRTVFEEYPRATTMEDRLIQDLTGSRVRRHPVPHASRVEILLADLVSPTPD